MESADNELLVSAASVWELSIKASLGQLELPEDLGTYFASEFRKWAIDLLPIQLSHVAAVRQLPWYHRDPFDRIMVAQAMVEAIPILTVDRRIARYAVEVVW